MGDGSHADLKAVKGPSSDQARSGTLLGYPECCVDADEESSRKMERMFIDALVAKVGPEKEAIKRAITEDVEVEIPSEPGMDRVEQTTTHFPFLIHICCESCLSITDSSSARLNAAFEEMIGKIDPAMRAAMVEVSTFLSDLDRATDREKVLQDIDRIHGSLYPRLVSR
jgi:hypothetical protein